LACDPEFHRKLDVAKTYQLAFVGNFFPGPRADLLDLLQQRFSQTFVGQAYFEEMARIYSASKVVFNRSLKNDLNMRVFEALACGSLLITNDLKENGQADLFQDGVHLATYQDADELIDKVDYYLKHDWVREKIAAAGRAEALAKHTYRHRMEALLERIAAAEPRVQVSPGDGQRVQDADLSYYEFSRPELLPLIPSTAHHVLEVGCGAGRLGESLKARQPAQVVGIELNVEAAERARQKLDDVLVGDVERLEPGFAPASFDCVVCGDVLEHLLDPESFLSRARSWLAPDGVLVASIPNVRHHSVVTALLEGNWTYEAAGLLDETHFSFFTRRDMVSLFERSGFRVKRVGIVPGPGYDDWQRQGSPGEVRIGRLHLANMPPEEAEEFYVYQYLLTATLAASSESEAQGDIDGAASLADAMSQAPPPREDHVGAHSRSAHAIRIFNAKPRSSYKRSRMRFTQDFVRDFEQFDFWSAPFAFVRFADGELAICQGRPIEAAQDGWSYDGRASQFADDLNAALTYAAPDYYVGISDGCCDRPARDWYLDRLNVPLEQVTFANIFVNGNYRRFRKLDLSGTALVSCRGGDFTIPEDLINSDFGLDELVDRLLTVDRPIVVAAGPAACVLIHKYWLRPGQKQTIVDIGSALDEFIKGRRTRRYHDPTSPTANRICQWSSGPNEWKRQERWARKRASLTLTTGW